MPGAGKLRRVSASALVCGTVFDGVSGELGGRTEILVRDGLIAEIGRSVDRPDGAEMIDLSDRTVTPELQRPVPQRDDTWTRPSNAATQRRVCSGMMSGAGAAVTPLASRFVR